MPDTRQSFPKTTRNIQRNHSHCSDSLGCQDGVEPIEMVSIARKSQNRHRIGASSKIIGEGTCRSGDREETSDRKGRKLK